MQTDIIVVGGGISGLLAGLRLSQRDSSRKILILESTERLGGRLLFSDFHGVIAPLGGSIIRNTDQRVLQLCREMGLTVKSFISDLKSKHYLWVNNFIERLKLKISEVSIEDGETVYTYLTRNFAPEEVDWFINNSVYRDFVDGNMKQFVKNYPLGDLAQPEGNGKEMYYIEDGYGKLVQEIVNRLRETPSVKIQMETEVRGIVHTGKDVKVETSKGDIQGNYVVWATGHQSYTSLPGSLQTKLDHVIGIPFIRVYGYSETPIPDFPELVTSGVIGKVFPKSDNVYQVAYVEGDWAVRLAAMLATQGTKSKQVDLMRQLLFQSLGREIPLTDIVYQYWSSGIHQFMKNKEGVVEDGLVVVIGEAVSANQGWVEGCVETVDFIMSNYERYFTRHPVPNHYSASMYLP